MPDSTRESAHLPSHTAALAATPQANPQGAVTDHELKVWPEYFDHLDSGAKTFEVRFDDRGFCPGDVLWLREWDPKTEDYTGRSCYRRSTYVLALDLFFEHIRAGTRAVAGYVVIGLAALREAARYEPLTESDIEDAVSDAIGSWQGSQIEQIMADIKTGVGWPLYRRVTEDEEG